MGRAILLLAALLAVAGRRAAAEAPPPASEAVADGAVRAFLELRPARTSFYVGEPIRLVLRIGIDEAFFTARAVPLFARDMDLPIHVDAPWLDELPPAESGPAEASLAGPRIGVNDDVRRAGRIAAEERAGRKFAVLELTRVHFLDEPGTLAIPETAFRFAWGTAVAPDFFGTPRAADRRDEVVRIPARTIEVAALPEAGRPDGFSGAVGRFSIRATSPATRVPAGDPFPVELAIEGEGNLARFDPPRPPEGFSVFGLTDDRARPVRTIRYELVAERAAETLPPFTLAYFDPGPPAGYRTAESKALPVAVIGPPSEAPAPVEESRGVSAAMVLVAAAAALLGAGLLLVAHRRRARRRAAEEGEVSPRERAAAELEERLARPDADPADAFARFLGAVLDAPPAAAISPDLAARLRAAGLGEADAEAAARTMEALVAARYGGGANPQAVEAARALARRLAEGG